MTGIRFIFCFSLLLLTFCGQAQEVRISNDVNIRNYFSYDIVGKVNDRIILFKDQGFTKEVDVFDQQMQHKFEAELILEDKKAIIYDIVNRDSSFQILYAFPTRDSLMVVSRMYNERVELLDSTILFSIHREAVKSKLKHVVSDDKKHLLFYFYSGDDGLTLNHIRNDSIQLDWQEEFEIEGYEVLSDLIGVKLDNTGRSFFLYEKSNSRFKKENHQARLIYFKNANSDYTNLFFDQKLSQDIVMEVDNHNERIFLAGLFNEKHDDRATGLFMLNKQINELNRDLSFSFINFSDTFFEEVSSSSRAKTKYLENFDINDLVLRQDGGTVLFAERNKVFSRRNPYQGMVDQPRDNYNRRGWTDFYNEDVIVMAFDEENQMEWKTVMYKKQFSQDDEAIYSSFFLFKTPSRVKLIYNDEIKKNNTVSQYILDPLGNTIRKSMLSTEYQNLKLRFKDAIQLSSSEMLIPSESSYILNLVKIDY